MSAGEEESGRRAAQDHYDSFWDFTASGVHLISRPIVIDGLRRPEIQIELAPRIRTVDGHLTDDAYHAVEHAAGQFYAFFTLEQLVMATVALRVHMRKAKAHVKRKKDLQERWMDLARHMKRLRVADEHLTFEEQRLAERQAALEGASGALQQLLAVEERELREKRTGWIEEKKAAQEAWAAIEGEDAELLEDAPHAESTEDLKYPYRLTLYGDRPEGPRGRQRSLSSAMNTLVEALQKPLSKTDQLLLEIALRRCVRASTPKEHESNPEAWESRLLREAEREFVKEFVWAAPFQSGAAG